MSEVVVTDAAVVHPRELVALAPFSDRPAAKLAAVAADLTPLHATSGQVLMRQGEWADSFLLIVNGSAEIRQAGANRAAVAADFTPGSVVGEIALLRHAPRMATVTAKDDLHGYLGYEPAFAALLEMPSVAAQLVRTARQRLAAFTDPVPIRARDGTELLLRPVLPGDSRRAAEGRSLFSSETLYRRFLSVRRLTPEVITYLCEVDYIDHFAWVLLDEPAGPIVAGARYVRDQRDPALAEIAVTVGDAYQGRGIGTLLLGTLAATAQLAGIDRFHAHVLADNWPSRALLDRWGAKWVCDGPGVLATTIGLSALHETPPLAAPAGIHDAASQLIAAFG
jgi:CRP-like cAMP-binding protein